ncbi:Tetratricopeptide TPR_2 repeat protein [unidentified eubacterium SCB49]|nr:Tetratricopeptide TPR_2 repeat protein [unidentified eubacterium SCB49]
MITPFQKIKKSLSNLTGFNEKEHNSFKNPLFILLSTIAFLTIVIAYSNHFSNSFHFDDSHTIENNSFIQEINIVKFFTDGTTFSSLSTNQSYRPLTTLENAIDYKLGGGLNPKIFHIHIFITFIITCALLLVFIKKILDKVSYSKNNQFWALLSTSSFGLLCANAETVNYIIQRAEIVAGLFVLAGFVAYLSDGFWRRSLLYLLFPFIGFFSKEMAFVFAPLLLLYFLIFEEKVDLLNFYKKEEFNKCLKSFKKVLPAFLLTLAFVIFYSKMLPESFSPGGFSRFNYLITQPMVMVHYIVTYFIPYSLSADTDWTVYTSILDYRAITGIVIIAILFYLALKASQKKETRLFSFGILWFFISLLPTSSFIPFAEVLNDHRSFIPYMGLTIAFIFGLTYLVQKYFSKALHTKPAQILIPLSIILFLGANAYGVHQRNKVWKDDLSLWKDVTIKSPNNGRGLMNYGLALMTKGDYDSAEKYFKEALILTPSYSVLHINLAVLNKAKGNKIEAEKYYKKAMLLAPSSHRPLFFYGKFLIDEGRVKEGQELLLKGLDISPNFAKAQDLLMKSYHELNQWEELNTLANTILKSRPNNKAALKYLDISLNKKTVEIVLEEDIEKNPTPEKYLNISLMYFNKGNFKKTIETARKALKLKSDYPEAYNNIGIAYHNLGKNDKAVEAYNKALKIKPDYTLAKNNLNNVLKKKNRTASANDFLNLSLEFYNSKNYSACIEAARKSNLIKPSANAYNNICAAYIELKEFDKAIEACNKAIKLDASHKLANGNLKHAISIK